VGEGGRTRSITIRFRPTKKPQQKEKEKKKKKNTKKKNKTKRHPKPKTPQTEPNKRKKKHKRTRQGGHGRDISMHAAKENLQTGPLRQEVKSKAGKALKKREITRHPRRQSEKKERTVSKGVGGAGSVCSTLQNKERGNGLAERKSAS